MSAPLHFLSPDQAFVVDAEGETVGYRCVASGPDLPAHLECTLGERSLDLDDGPLLPLGPSPGDTSSYLGRYHVDQWGKPALEVVITERHGYLYLNETRLSTEIEPHLFSTVDGETIDFREHTPVWKSLRLIRDT